MHKQDNQYQVKFFEMSQTTTELNKQKEHPFQTDVAGGHAEQVSCRRVNPALGVLTFGSITCKFKKTRYSSLPQSKRIAAHLLHEESHK